MIQAILSQFICRLLPHGVKLANRFSPTTKLQSIYARPFFAHCESKLRK